MRGPFGFGYSRPDGFWRGAGSGESPPELVGRAESSSPMSYPYGAQPSFTLFILNPFSARNFPLMVNPTPFFAPDYFATQDVTLPRLQKFSLDVAQRLALDNPGGAFTALLADLTAYHTALFGSMAATDAGISQRRTGAQLLWGALADLQHQLEEDEALIDYKSKKNPAIRLAFFPNGRTEYSKASLLTADLLFARAEKAALTHAKTLGTEFDPALYTRLYTAFKAGRDDTGAGDEQSAKARAEAQAHRSDLTARLSDAVKLVAAQFLRGEARCAAYFRVGLLQAPAPATPTDTKP